MRQYGGRNGEVEVATGFREFGGGEIDGDFCLCWDRETGITDSGTDALTTFFYCFVGHTDDIEAWEPVRAVAFDGYEVGGEARWDS